MTSESEKGGQINDQDVFVLALSLAKGYGPAKVFNYISNNGFDYDRCISNISKTIIDEDYFSSLVARSQEIISKNKERGIDFISMMNGSFPKKLYSGSDKCIYLFYIGDVSLLQNESVAVIGTRKPDEPFISKGRIITKKLTEMGYVIVSGLALGCDTIAHTECLDNGGKTIAVLPSPCDNIYPSSNTGLAKRVVDGGGLLISEYGTGSGYDVRNYPKRDRIQSFLSFATVVIQAIDSGGTRFAVERSIMDGKFVCAIRGNRLEKVKEYIDCDDDLGAVMAAVKKYEQKTLI